MSYLYWFTGAAVLLSLIADRRKTWKAGKIAVKRFIRILPAFLLMLILVSFTLFLIPSERLSQYLGGKPGLLGLLPAALIGSITLMPGFIAFPLCGILLKQGVPYMVLSAFTTTLMMVGVVTYPVEKAYLGTSVTILRNALSLLIALIVALVTGLFFGELL